MSKIFSLLFSSLFIPITSYAQFSLIGTADYMAGDCIQLTPDEEYTSGMAYHRTKLDLSRFFEIEFDVYFGDKDELGADGIAFVVHNDPRGYEAYGFWGEGLGYGRIFPSVAIEFDTYQNAYRNDPACDHVAYLENGVVFQDQYWNNEDSNFNLEDDYLHNFRFQWNPKEKSIVVYLDNAIVFQGKRDLINEVFNGATQVIWGFTASTGRKHNLQYFCLRKWTRRTPLELPSPSRDTRLGMDEKKIEMEPKKKEEEVIMAVAVRELNPGSSPQGKLPTAQQ